MEFEIKLNQSLTAKNDEISLRIKNFLKKNNIFCINLMGGPGSGKTTLIEILSNHMKNIYVLQGDLKSDIDTERLIKKNISCYQINTHSGCHLNASMIESAIKKIDLSKTDYLIIENVGNLVCPAGVLIGQNLNLVINSVAEGNDKPEKYPLIFRDSQAVILTKYDLKDAVEFNEEEYLKRLEKITRAPLFKISNKDKNSVKELVKFIENFSLNNLN